MYNHFFPWRSTHTFIDIKATWGKQTCPRFETASVGFELGTSGFRDPRSYPLGHLRSFQSPCAVESCPTLGDNRGSTSLFGSISGVPYQGPFMLFTLSSHLVRGLPRLLFPLITPSITPFSIPLSRHVQSIVF